MYDYGTLYETRAAHGVATRRTPQRPAAAQRAAYGCTHGGVAFYMILTARSFTAGAAGARGWHW